MENLDGQIQDQENQEQGVEAQAGTRYMQWEITLKIAANVTTRYKLMLNDFSLEHGKWKYAPQAQIAVPQNVDNEKVIIKSEKRTGNYYGTEGSFSYISEDSTTNPAKFTFEFAIPYYKEGYCIVKGGSSNYQVDQNIENDGKSKKAFITITQVKPTI